MTTTDQHPQTAVIILNWNGAELLRRFLPSVIANTPEDLADVIVADNGSSDKSLQILAEEFPSVKVIRFRENLGFAEGYNRAIASCAGYGLTVLLNSDVETPEGWLQPIVNAMDADPALGHASRKYSAITNAGNSNTQAHRAGLSTATAFLIAEDACLQLLKRTADNMMTPYPFSGLQGGTRRKDRAIS